MKINIYLKDKNKISNVLVNNKNKGPIPAASIATNNTAKELKKVELILNIYFGGSDGTRTRDLSRDRRSL